MLIKNDDWDIQEVFRVDPQKAFFVLSSNILQPEKLAGNMVKAIKTQSELQHVLKDQNLKLITKDHDIRDALFEIISKERKQFYSTLILNKVTLLLGLLLILVLLGINNISDWGSLIHQLLNLK